MNQTEKPLTFFRFEDLRIYHKALDYILWVNSWSKLFLENNNESFIRDFNKSARNIALNIAEGSAQNKQIFVEHLKKAKVEIRNCVVYTTLASVNGYINEDEENDSRNQLMEMTKMLGALITSLLKNVSSSQDNQDEEETLY